MAALPNAYRVILLVLSVASFLPQYHRILSRQDCVGISPLYLLFNLVAATQPFALGLHHIVTHEEHNDILQSPPSLGNWLDVAQLAATWVCQAFTFGLYVYYGPSRYRARHALVAIYLTFALLSLVPIIIESAMLPDDPNAFSARHLLSAFISVGHFLATPIITAIACAALFPQARELESSQPGPVALSINGLAAQALIFAIVGSCWPLRMKLARHVSFVDWYLLVGWATVDNLVFSIVQAVLWLLSTRRMQSTTAGGDETTPLIG